CEEIENLAGGRHRLIELVANPALTGFTAPKILWVRQHEPKVYAKTKHILLPKDYVRYRMTGEYATEVSDASGTLLLDGGNRVVGGAGDQAAGAVGNGIVAPGIVSATLGTSGVFFAHSDQPTRDPRGRVHTMCHAIPGKWCVFGCMLSAGGSFQWFRNNLGQEEVAQS